MKARFIVIPLALIVLAVAGIAAFLMSTIDNYRPRIQAELQQKLNRQVSLGKLGLRLLPLSIRVEGLSIAESPQFPSQRAFASANQVYVSAGLFSLIRGSPEVTSIVLDRPQIELIRNTSGVWNFSTLAGGATNNTSSGADARRQFSLGKLQITDGQLGYTDEKAKQPRAVYDHIDLTVTDFAPQKQFGVDVGVHFPGEGKQLLAFKGNAGPLGTASSSLPPLNGHLALQQVSLSGVNRFMAGAIPPHTDTVASGDADITSAASGLTCKGDLKLENTVVHGSKIDFPIDARYDVNADSAFNKLQARSAAVQLGATTFNISGDTDMSSKPANLNLRLTTKDSSITELAKLAGAFGVAFNPAYKVNGTLSADVTARGPATMPQLNGTIDAKGLQASGGEIKQPVSASDVNLALTPATVQSNTFKVQSGATALSVVFALSHYATKNMLVDATLKTDGANITELLNMAKAYGVSATKGVSGSGKLSLNAHVQGPVADSSKLTYAGTANIASATLSAQNIVLTNLNTNAQLNQGTITLSPLSAGIFGGTANGILSADMRPATPLCSTKAKLSGVDANALLSAFSSMKNTLYGALAADGNLRFALASGNDLARTLNGTLAFSLANGQLKNVNIMNEISKVGKFLNSAAASKAGSGTDLKQFSGTLNVVNGVATTNDLKAVLDQGSLSANGSLNLVNQALNLHMTAVLASGISKAVGGTGVGGFLNTALANNNGELVLPVLVTGSTDHPLFAPDVQAMAKMKINRLLPTSGDPSKATSGALGSVLGGVLGKGAQQQQGQQQQNPVNSILNQFKKKKQ